MSLFQCEHCGCCENTALSSVCIWYMPEGYDWADMEDRRGKKLCSACGPSKHSDGTKTRHGQWHGKFKRTYLPIGMFKTNQRGNLEHIQTGEEDFMKYAIKDNAA